MLQTHLLLALADVQAEQNIERDVRMDLPVGVDDYDTRYTHAPTWDTLFYYEVKRGDALDVLLKLYEGRPFPALRLPRACLRTKVSVRIVLVARCRSHEPTLY